MKWDYILRAVGVAALVAAYGIYRFSPGEPNIMIVLTFITAILALISPEAVDALPVGPSK